jgi:hypothetical protein
MTAILAPTERRRIDVGPPTEPPTWREVPPIERAWYAVHDLPNYPTEIARLLHNLGITGRRGEATNCPLGNFVRWRVPGLGLAYVAIDLDMVDLGGGDWFEFPEHVYAFVRNFDEGCYPTLVEHLALPAPERSP